MADENGAAYAVFSVRLSGASDNLINVAWHTEDGTGHAGTDYKATSGTVTFLPGETEQQIQVEVYGRTPGQSTEDRTFLIRLLPPVGAVLEAATAECTISVVTEDDAVFTMVWLPAGPRGRPGDGGLPGLSTFELAKLNGFEGTLGQWLATVTGRNIELQKSATYIQWRPVDTENPQAWQDLVALSEITGDDGKQVQLQKSSTAIQWRLEGGVWADLVPLADLKADPQPLINRSNWVSGTTYNPGDYVAATATASSAKSLYFLIDAAPYVSNTEPKDDLTHWLELSPPQGADGREVEFQKTSTAVQWRYVGDASWTTLFLLSDVQGDPGKNPEFQLNEEQDAVQWRLEGDTDWQTLFALALIKGADGENIELQKGATYIQWRVVGDTVWQNLIAVADITGEAGADGSTWLSGTTVPSSAQGKDTDFYLKIDTGGIYKKASGAWTLQMTIGGSSGGIQWYSGTSAPSNSTGKDGDLHLHETTGMIRKRVTGAWANLLQIPLLATSDQAKAAALATVAATPAGVREFMEQYGFTASYMNDSANLNTITSTTDRTVCFGFNNTTLNTPVAGSYGRGLQIAGGGNYTTQIAIINDSGNMYVRFHSGTSWSAWIGKNKSSREIYGLNLTVNSTTLTVGAGEAFISSLNGNLVVTSDLSVSFDTLSASTWYHVYLYSNAGAPAVEYSTAAPVDYAKPAKQKTGDASRRYLGSFRTDASSVPLQEVCRNGKCDYQLPLNSKWILSAGQALTQTTVSVASFIPVTALAADIKCNNNSGNNVDGLLSAISGGYGTTVWKGLSQTLLPLMSYPNVYYNMSAAPGTGGLFMTCEGYTYER